ncbi:EAL domain-containing protein [Pantoea stewartii]|uniref:EAL domain-containing protein n=2 Tax=Pantoea TaxID=53335 RepID=UPI0024BD93BA|nr:EAL domain-containing protein [Pantoea stewartii]
MGMEIHNLDNNNRAWWFIAEPVVNNASTLIAVEVLTRFAAPGTPCFHIAKLNKQQKIKLLREQLSLIDKKRHFFEENQLLCSVNVDLEMAFALLEERDIVELATAHSFLRIEVAEHFPDLAQGLNNPLLRELHNKYTLWLDDFGSAASHFPCLQRGMYEAVKIDKHFFWRHRNSPVWQTTLAEIKHYCEFIIVEGIETAQHFEFARPHAAAFQGYLFKAFLFDTLA